MSSDAQEQRPDLLRQAASGLRTDDLARLAGISVRAARRRLAHEVSAAAAVEPSADEQRTIELVHLDLLRRSLMSTALRGDLAAARILLRVHENRAALLGLVDLPDEIEQGVTVVDDLRARRSERRAAAHLRRTAEQQ